MKHCNPNLIAEYVNGELDASAASEYGRHIESCPVCSAQSELFESFRKAVRPSESIDEAFTRRVMAQVKKRSATDEHAAPSLFSQWLFPALQLAFALAVFAVQAQSHEVLDVGSVLIGDVSAESVSEEFSPSVSDLSEALGIPVGDS